MKKLLFLLSLVALLSSCAHKKYEYKTIKVEAQTGSYGDFSSTTLSDPTSELNKLGAEGWELVGVYTETNTVFPNFGKDEYVTGIRTNTRTSCVNFVLKREAAKLSSAGASEQ